MSLDRAGVRDNRESLAAKALEGFIGDFRIEGQENIGKLKAILEGVPGTRPVVTAPHLSNLDAPAAILALNKSLDLHMGVDSWHFGLTPQHLLYILAGKEHFSPISGGASFRTREFAAFERAAKAGKTPWIALHGYTDKGEMESARVGAVYLAHRLARPGGMAVMLPTALDVEGVGAALNGPVDMAKAAINKLMAVYKIGEPLGLDSVNVGIIEQVLEKKAKRLEVTTAEKEEFARVVGLLKAQADIVARATAELLPESKRGPYARGESPV